MVCVFLVLLLIRIIMLIWWLGSSVSEEYMFDRVLVCVIFYCLFMFDSC